MRRIYISGMLAAMLVFVIGSSAMAQPGVPKISIGAKAGLNFATVDDLESVETLDVLEAESKTGFIGGGFIKFPMGGLSLQIEGLYSIKGGKGESKADGKIWEWEAKFTYIDVPVLLRYDFPTPLLKPYIFGGGTVSFLLDAEAYHPRYQKEFLKIKDITEDIDYGLVVGGGIQLGSLFVEARYNHGLKDVLGEGTAVELIKEAKNRTYSVMVGMTLF